MNALRVLRSIIWCLAFAVVVVLVITSITHGDIQEFCATAVYAGTALCALLLVMERILERRSGGFAD